MLKKHSISLIIAVVLITPITVFAIVQWIENKGRELPVYKGENLTIADFSLSNQNGQNVTLQDWENKIIVADFFFTHCPVICPKMTSNIKKVQSAFSNKENLQFNSFSVDPERDSIAQLKVFAKKFGVAGNWNLLTGEKVIIYRLARESFSVAATDGDGGEHDFIHSDKLVLLDIRHRIRGYYSGTSDKDVLQLINDIKKLYNEM
ncbi:MAG TPA: SCO family protein [Flavisolibacter sp.]|jgi:protein SCO1/2|nr:SCO family protein [Flavisolibacter sp.]